jgi:hypothetical protein
MVGADRGSRINGLAKAALQQGVAVPSSFANKDADCLCWKPASALPQADRRGS